MDRVNCRNLRRQPYSLWLRRGALPGTSRIVEGLVGSCGSIELWEGVGVAHRPILSVIKKARGMRPIGHPDFQYTPWSPERRAAASKAANLSAFVDLAKSVLTFAQ
jgi:hypothetical protein